VHIKVMLEYFYPWTNSAGIYLARQKGWYKDVGLDVECRTYDPLRGDSLTYLANGEVDFALFPSNRLLVRREQGAPVQGVAAINHRGLEAIQTIKQTGISRPRDLSGKRIALNPTPRGMAMIRHIIENDGGNPNFIVVNSGVRELLSEDIAIGKADATFGSYWAWEILLDSAIPQNERIVWPVDEIGAPPYHSYLLGTNTPFSAQHPDVVRAFLAATQKGYVAVVNNPSIAVSIYEQVAPYFPESLIRRSLPLISKTWTHNGVWGHQRAALLKPYAHWLKKHGILANANIWKEAVDNSFLPSL